MRSLVFTSAFLLLSYVAYASPTLEKKAATTSKYVIAHHMVGNTYPYTIADWTEDITLASQHGIDAFALNVGSDSWQPARVADAYTAAKNSGTGFKLFLSLDTSALACSSTADAANLANWVSQYSKHPNQFLYPPSNPKVFLSTFSGSSCTFGQSNAANGWSFFKSKLTGSNSVYFVPAYFVDPASFQSSGLANSMDGGFQWNAAWQVSVTTPSLSAGLAQAGSSIPALPNAPYNSAPQGVVKNLLTNMAADNQWINPLKSLGKTYMTSVSPWFFTHYSPQTYNKNWVYLSDYLYPLRWQTVVANRNNFDLAEIITWNDYGESHYIGPIHGAQPNSQAWVNGMDHTPWLNLTLYYATAYKTGSYPAITKDSLFMWARTHPANATATSDSVGPPTNYAIMQDSIFVVCMATSAGSVAISTNANGSGAKTFSVSSGVNIWEVPLVPGGTMWGQLTRNGKTVLTLKPSFTYVAKPSTYNYNAFVAGTSA